MLFAAMLIRRDTAIRKRRVTLSGTVTDSRKKPLQFVTVRFFKQNNLQTPLQTTLSKENGAFNSIKRTQEIIHSHSLIPALLKRK